MPARISRQTNVMTFKGRDNLTYDIVVTDMPSIPAPEERGEDIVIPGRDGSLWRSDRAWEPVEFPVRFWVPPETARQNVERWLSGSGKLRFQDCLYNQSQSYAPVEYYYKARVRDMTLVPRNFHDGWDGTVTFAIDPYKYIDGEDIGFRTSQSGSYIINPYPTDSLPIITVHCQGPFDLTVGGEVLSLEGSYDITGAVIIDSEKQLVYRRATGQNLLQYMTGSFPVLKGTYAGGGGRTRIMWEGRISAEVTYNTVVVKPNWRIMDSEGTWDQLADDPGAGTMDNEAEGGSAGI